MKERFEAWLEEQFGPMWPSVWMVPSLAAVFLLFIALLTLALMGVLQ